MKRFLSTPQSQSGIALVTSLLVLVLVTMLALSAVSTSVFEERMAGNSRDRTLAFESAEYAMREAQSVLTGAVVPVFSTTGGATGGYFRDLNTSPSGQAEEGYWRDNHDWTANAVEVPTPPVGEGILDGQEKPKFVIEEYPAISCEGYSKRWPPPPPRNVYKVTARGLGRTTEAVVILQSWYDRGCG